MAIIKEMKFYISSTIDNLTPSGLTDGEPERNDISVEGFYKISDDGYEITYSEQTEGGRVVSDIIITESSVTVKRRGAVDSEMVFSEGLLHKSLYTVSPYSFDAEVLTKRIRSSLTKDGGKIDIFYNMKIGGADKAARMKIWRSRASNQN